MDGVSFALLSFDPVLGGFGWCGGRTLCFVWGRQGWLTGVVVVLLKRGWTNRNANPETGTNGVLDWSAGSRSPR